MRQVGDQIRLEWKAPSRNQDGTTEKLDLLEARVMRRVIDIAALVKEQTRTPEPVASSETESEASSETELAADEEVAAVPQTPAQPGAPEEPEAERARTEEALLEDATESRGEPPAAPRPPLARPSLAIPPFVGAAEVVATLESLEAGEAMSFDESIDPAWLGKRVEYAVVHVNRKKRASPLSTILQVEPVPEPQPPAALGAAAGDGFVSLEWSPPEKPAGTDRSVGFAVFRRLGTDAGYPESPLASETIRESSFEDRSVVFGVPTCYVVSTVLAPARPEPEDATPAETPPQQPAEVESRPEEALSRPGGVETPAEEGSSQPEAVETIPEEISSQAGVPLVPPIANPVRVESRPSEEICLTPEDVFAPAAPSGLVGVAVGDGILLTWRVVEAPDLRGYRVYRRAESSVDFEFLEEVGTASYTDATAALGERYVYAVTAVDASPAVNESPRSEAVLATRRE